MGAPLALTGQLRAQNRPTEGLDGGPCGPGPKSLPVPSSQLRTHLHDQTRPGGCGICLDLPLARSVSSRGWRRGTPLPPQKPQLNCSSGLSCLEAQINREAFRPSSGSQPEQGGALKGSTWGGGGETQLPFALGPLLLGPPAPVPSLSAQTPHFLRQRWDQSRSSGQVLWGTPSLLSPGEFGIAGDEGESPEVQKFRKSEARGRGTLTLEGRSSQYL